MATHADLAVDPVPSSVREQKDDEAYDNDFRTTEALFRSLLDQSGYHAFDGARLAAMVMQKVDEHGYVMSDHQWLADFYEKWGAAAVLRALARASEPVRLTPLVDEVEHP